MKQKNNLWSDVSKLIIAVLAAMAFLRGTAQLVVLIAAFAIWGTYASYRYLVPYIKEKIAEAEAKKVQSHYKKQEEQTKKDWDIDVSDPTSLVLLRHASHRITAHLKATYPDATWGWACDDPEKIICKGGTGRIKLNGIADFNFAEVTFNQNAEMKFQLLNVVPFVDKKKAAPTEGEKKPTVETNPQVWFEQQGKKVLKGLIADLHSRGYNSLIIAENGDVIVKQGDKPFKQRSFTSMPDKVSWPRLKKVMESDGIATEITENGLVLSW